MFPGKLVCPGLLAAAMLLAQSAPHAGAQAAFPQTSMRALVGGNGLGGPKSAGTLVLAAAGASFESPDFVFNVPADEILSVEPKGARDGFLTLVLDPHSKFIAAYPSLVTQRTNSINQPEHLLVVTLDPSEPVNTELTRAKGFQGFIQQQRAAREQATVGVTAADSAAGPAHPSLGKTVHVVLKGTGAEPAGLLTFFPDHLQFDSPDVTIRMAQNQIEEMEPAGARESFLQVKYDGKSSFATAYRKYQNVYRYGSFLFVLSPQEAVAPAYKLAQDYTAYTAAVRAGQEQAIVNGQNAAGAPLQPGPVAGAEKRELARYNAGFLERHNPGNSLLNGFKVINGIPGELIAFDTGLGYVSEAQNPSVKPARQTFLQNGYLKFFVPQQAILGMRDVSVIRNASSSNVNSYIAEVDLDRNSNFYLQSKALLADSDKDNRLFFSFKEQYQLRQFLANGPKGAGARDAF